jgi:hypothetical protein
MRCHIVATIDRRIAIRAALARPIAGFKCNCPRHLLAANRESAMELQSHVQTKGQSATGITREMLGLALDALVTGATTALIAGALVVLLVINNS